MFRKRRKPATCLIAIGLLATATGIADAAAQPVPVDLELAFVVDASGSIDQVETQLQRQGYADALIHPRVLAAIKSGFLGSVSVAYIEFAGETCERLSVPWTRIDGLETAQAFAARILARDRMFCPGGNAIGDALAFARDSMETNEFQGTRRVIDISGDGPNTLGRSLRPTRDAIVASGITINGLVIDRPEMPDLESYYRESVTGGRGSFVIRAENRLSFADAILKKLILEIAAR